MDISRLSRKYRYENGNFIQNSGRYVGDTVDQKRIQKELIDAGVTIEEIPEALNALASACSKKFTDNSDDIENEILEIINNNKSIMSDYRLVKIRGQLETFTYFYNGRIARLIQAGVPKTQEWVEILRNSKPRELAAVHKQLAHKINPKRPNAVTIECTAERIINQLSIDMYMDEDAFLELEQAPRPVSLSTDDILSSQKIDYSPNDNPQLNPTLQELLSRCTDSEYLCAILWLMFCGKKTPYVVYLYGEGGEGKSSFTGFLTRMLGEAITATFDSNNNFSNIGMFNKALILLSENVNCRLLQKSEVKALTGDSYVSIEPKGKDRFSAKLSGLLMVDSNTLPLLEGENYEFRRLRLFRFSQFKCNTEIDKETYENMLSENFNDFLNHCRICYEKLGGANTVPASPAQIAEFGSLKDLAAITASKNLWRQVKKAGHYELDSHGTVDEAGFYQALSTCGNLRELRKSYADRDLFSYLRTQHGVVREKGRIKGISVVAPEGTYFDATSAG
ncbi:DUF5906 domain-containing protein [Fluviispira vulneris]|uniref:DUF5906 domain-containing protein n=1 Tax=Fluviispira vulneris TaxID=2763012 RepID=UPI001644AC11|nr:DUF5906 domain-containing protein [Fluviispira vulneris]